MSTTKSLIYSINSIEDTMKELDDLKGERFVNDTAIGKDNRTTTTIVAILEVLNNYGQGFGDCFNQCNLMEKGEELERLTKEFINMYNEIQDSLNTAYNALNLGVEDATDIIKDFDQSTKELLNPSITPLTTGIVAGIVSAKNWAEDMLKGKTTSSASSSKDTGGKTTSSASSKDTGGKTTSNGTNTIYNNNSNYTQTSSNTSTNGASTIVPDASSNNNQHEAVTTPDTIEPTPTVPESKPETTQPAPQPQTTPNQTPSQNQDSGYTPSPAPQQKPTPSQPAPSQPAPQPEPETPTVTPEPNDGNKFEDKTLTTPDTNTNNNNSGTQPERIPQVNQDSSKPNVQYVESSSTPSRGGYTTNENSSTTPELLSPTDKQEQGVVSDKPLTPPIVDTDTRDLFDDADTVTPVVPDLPSSSTSTSTDKGFNPIPLAVGLGAAVAGAVGVKAYKDHKENSSFNDTNEEGFTNGNRFWSEEEPNVIHSEQNEVSNETLLDEQATSPSYAAIANNANSEIDVNDDTWSIEDNSEENNLRPTFDLLGENLEEA